MRRTPIALIIGAGIGMAGSASAADMRRPVYKAAPPPVVVYNWSGFYVGGFAGGAFGGDTTATDLNGWNFPRNHSWSYGVDSSFIGGGTIGWNWQAPGSPWVFGVGGELGYIHLKGSGADPRSPTDTFAHTKYGDWYGFAGGRLGYAWDRVMLYAKGGAAFVDTDVGVIDACRSGPCGGGLINATRSDTITTWAVGGGIEWAWVPNWTFKVEYLYIDVSRDWNVCGVPVGGGNFCWQHDIEGIHTVKAGLNYKFDWGKGPVMARY